jgi:hypothetical protein
MKPNRIRFVGIAAVLSAIAIAAPVSTAGAAVAVTGQTFIATPAATFINYHSQTSAGDLSSGSQVAP